MSSESRVCPFCGEPPGAGVFCGACGRSLADVERLPTRREWEIIDSGVTADSDDLATRCAAATADFLTAMHAAGDPGAKEVPVLNKSAFKRTRKVKGWVVRAVDREDFDGPKRYEPGLVLTVDGAFYRYDSEIRGWGQRGFPHYHHTVAAEPVEPPVEPRLIAELAAVLQDNGVAA